MNPSLNIYQAMAQIMKSVEAIKKEKTNTQGAGFKYRGIDDVMNSLHNAFSEAGVFITTEVKDRTEVERTSKSGGALFYVTQKIMFTFHAPDGTSVSSTVFGTAMDSGDKADNKGLSIGLKYALLQAFLIPTEDMAEPDSQTHEVKPRQAEVKAPGKMPMKPAVWTRIIERITSGEHGIPEKVRQTFELTPIEEIELKRLDAEAKAKLIKVSTIPEGVTILPKVSDATNDLLNIPSDIEDAINNSEPLKESAKKQFTGRVIKDEQVNPVNIQNSQPKIF